MRTFTETLAMAYMIFMVLLFVDIASGAAPIFYSAGYVEANGDSIDIGTGIAVPACGVWDMSGTGAWDLVLSDGVFGKMMVISISSPVTRTVESVCGPAICRATPTSRSQSPVKVLT